MTSPLPAEWDAWLQEGAGLRALPPLRRSEVSTRGPEDKKFAIGDFLLTIPAEFVEPLAKALGEDPSAFRAYRDVAAKVPPERRVAAAWSVHRDLKETPDLLRAGLTVREAALLAGKRPIDSKASHRETVGEKADRVRELLADPDVAAIIEAERHMSADERRARRAAMKFTSEMAAKAKELEAERRALREAKSPYEATVKVLLELHKAAQVADAVGEAAGDLEQPERLADALRTLIASASAALERFDVEDKHIVIDAEAWQARPEAYGTAESAQRALPPTGRVVDL